MPLINTRLVRIIRTQIGINTYLNRTFYHPQIIFNKKHGEIVKYINMDDKTINKLTQLTNQFDRKFLQLHFVIPSSDTYYFDNNEIIAYQFKNNYLLSSINILSNGFNGSNKTNTKFDINKFIPTLSLT